MDFRKDYRCLEKIDIIYEHFLGQSFKLTESKRIILQKVRVLSFLLFPQKSIRRKHFKKLARFSLIKKSEKTTPIFASNL